jgi:hypothetical protein
MTFRRLVTLTNRVLPIANLVILIVGGICAAIEWYSFKRNYEDYTLRQLKMDTEAAEQRSLEINDDTSMSIIELKRFSDGTRLYVVMNKSNLLKATHSGEIYIGNTALPCYVLEDGTRVLTQTGAVQSLGMGQFAQLPKFMSHERLKPFISKDLTNLLENRITFTIPSGGKPAHAVHPCQISF